MPASRDGDDFLASVRDALTVFTGQLEEPLVKQRLAELGQLLFRYLELPPGGLGERVDGQLGLPGRVDTQVPGAALGKTADGAHGDGQRGVFELGSRDDRRVRLVPAAWKHGRESKAHSDDDKSADRGHVRSPKDTGTSFRHRGAENDQAEAEVGLFAA